MQPVLIVVVVVVLYILSSIKILRQYEKGVIFRLGKLLAEPKGPGVILVFWPIDQMERVSLRTVTFDVPAQDVITRDNVTVKVNAIVYFRVVDANRAIVSVENYLYATSQLAQTTLRSGERWHDRLRLSVKSAPRSFMPMEKIRPPKSFWMQPGLWLKNP
jgi:regulator of protease activity HflC (stomatin/prohibitin superfamily)